MTGREALIYEAIKHEGDWDEILLALKRKECPSEEEVMKVIGGLDCEVITIIEDRYPKALKNIYKPPLVLFYRGNFELIEDMGKCIAYVGSRDSTPYGEKMAKSISEDLAAEGFTIVSGLALGIDSAATKAAIKYKRAVAVLGNGIDYCYPSKNADLQKEIERNGLLISEYPGKLPPKSTSFPFRNRIIAGLATCVVVGEAHEHSGTLITVSYALNHGRDVCCVPYPAESGSSCNSLIKEGAPLVENAVDVFRIVGYEKAVPPVD